jgi:hypothetical protein
MTTTQGAIPAACFAMAGILALHVHAAPTTEN